MFSIQLPKMHQISKCWSCIRVTWKSKIKKFFFLFLWIKSVKNKTKATYYHLGRLFLFVGSVMMELSKHLEGRKKNRKKRNTTLSEKKFWRKEMCIIKPIKKNKINRCILFSIWNDSNRSLIVRMWIYNEQARKN